MYTPSSDSRGGAIGRSLHQSLDIFQQRQAAGQPQGAGGRPSLPNILHDALYSARMHQTRANVVSAAALAKQAQRDGQREHNTGISSEALAAATGHATITGGDWQNELMADFMGPHGHNLRSQPIAMSLASQHHGGIPVPRPPGDYRSVVQERDPRTQQQLHDAIHAVPNGRTITVAPNYVTGVAQQHAPYASHPAARPVPQEQPLPARQPLAERSVDRGSDRAIPVAMQLSPLPPRSGVRPSGAPHSTQTIYHPQGQQLPHMALGTVAGSAPGTGNHSSADRACSSHDSTTQYLDCHEQIMGAVELAATPESGYRLTLVYEQSYVYRPVSYPDHSSQSALAMANNIMLRLNIPGGVKYKPVHYHSKLFQQGSRFGFTAFAICLGSSYFQRLLAGMPHLEYAVRRSGGGFQDYLDFLGPCSDRRLAALHAQFGGQYTSANQITEESTLSSIQYTCIYLATKMVDRMPMLEMLRYILTHLYGSVVTKAQAYDVESKCLEGLGFRLGPYFHDDVLEDDWPY